MDSTIISRPEEYKILPDNNHNQKKKTHILIVENQYLVIESLKILLSSESFEICNITDSWDSLNWNQNTTEPDIIIIDHSLFLVKADEFIKIGQNNPGTSFLILANQINQGELIKLVQAGIKNIIYKNADKDELLKAIEATKNGKKYFSEEILELFIDLGDRRKNTSYKTNITKTENEIIQLITQGLSTKEIAEQKNVSFHTVMTHRKNIFRKLNIKSASELFQYALKTGLIAPV